MIQVVTVLIEAIAMMIVGSWNDRIEMSMSSSMEYSLLYTICKCNLYNLTK